MHARSSCLFIISLALGETEESDALRTLTELCHYAAFPKELLLINCSLNYEKTLKTTRRVKADSATVSDFRKYPVFTFTFKVISNHSERSKKATYKPPPNTSSHSQVIQTH